MPSGRPAWRNSSAISSEGEGSRSLGLRMKALPVTMASGAIHIGTMKGKLKGVMPATTPNGWRSVQLSMPAETWSLKSPFSSCGAPQANSTMSMPRATSPWASLKTLPCSAVIMAASSSLCACSSSRNLNITRARRSGGAPAQAGKAACAAATAALTSSRLASCTWRAMAPVAGWKTGWRRPELAVCARPAMKWPTSALARNAWGWGWGLLLITISSVWQAV